MNNIKNLLKLTVTLAFMLAVALLVKTDAKAADHASVGDYLVKDGIRYVITQAATDSDAGCVSVAGVEDSSLTKVVIYGTVYDTSHNDDEYSCTAMNSSAFKNNTKITEVWLNESVQIKTIPSYAFYGCKNLKTVVLRMSCLKTIDKYAFAKCTNLSTLAISSTKLTKSSIKANSFKNVKNLTIYVRSSKKSKYVKFISNRGAKSVTYGGSYVSWLSSL
ncbi:MAG: leucine-rich repeat domain-containing protein [Butyrivibrio sp.]|nr:leucine-rich repeat domain-containing protein [Butyrivibrio sp.]